MEDVFLLVSLFEHGFNLDGDNVMQVKADSLPFASSSSFDVKSILRCA